MRDLSDILDELDQEEKPSAYVRRRMCLGSTEFHEESVGSQVEFFDDHQQWMIESFDKL